LRKIYIKRFKVDNISAVFAFIGDSKGQLFGGGPVNGLITGFKGIIIRTGIPGFGGDGEMLLC